MTEKTEESDEQYLERVFPRKIYETENDAVEHAVFQGIPLKRNTFREFILGYMAEVGERPKYSEFALMLLAYQSIRYLSQKAWSAAVVWKEPSALPFTYTDDICQIGEHDVCFSGVELTKDVGEFKAGQKFEAATIDFQGGHLTLETAAGREHRYSFTVMVGAKHEGHSCSGCGILAGKLCAQHA